MSKRIVLIRHAKSSWANPGQPDIERPLNSRGRKDALMMGQRLRSIGCVPERIYTSSAVRTVETTALILEGLQLSCPVEEDRFLYHASPERLEDQISAASDTCNTIFIIAHNPGITQLVNELIPGWYTDNVPTCGIFAFRLEADKWTDYHQAKRTLIFYDYPKNNSLDG